MEFVTDSINRILSLYDAPRSSAKGGRTVPSSVVLIGHSMGGIVARSVFLSPSYRIGTVRTILTLNAPHVIAPVLMHSSVQEFYERVNAVWQDRTGPLESEIRESVVLSVAGGWRDPQIHASLTSLESVAFGRNQVSVLATSVPDVWVTMDHDSCMWCNQLVVTLAEYLTEIIDPQTRQLTKDTEKRLVALRKHFQSRVPSALGFNMNMDLEYKKMDRKEGDDTQTKEKKVDGNVALENPILRLHGESQLAAFNGFWNSGRHNKYTRIQMITTLQLDDITASLCSPLECVDLMALAAPIPYDIREHEHRNFKTLKAFVLDADLTRFGDFETLRFSTSLKPSSKRNPAKGHDLFLFVQLSSGVYGQKIYLGSYRSLGAHEATFGGDIISHFTLSDPLKYVAYQADVSKLGCDSDSYLKPVLLQYTHSMLHEERYAQDSLLLKVHEPTAIVSNAKLLNDTQSLSSYAKLNSQVMETSDLHLFVFSDPQCRYRLLLTFDRHASSEILLRTYGVFILSFLCAVTMLISGAQESAAHKMLLSSSDNLPTVLNALVQLMISKRMVLLLIAIILPSKLPMFKTVGSAIDLLPGPRPDLFVLVMMLSIGIGLLTIWSIITLALFRFVDAKFGDSIPPHHINAPSHMGLIPFRQVMRMCFSRNAILAFIAIMTVGLLLDKTILIFASLVLLLLPLPLSTLSFMNAKQKEAMLRLRHGYFVMYSVMLVLVAPQLLIRLQDLQHGFSVNITAWKVIQTPLIPVFSLLLRYIPPWWEPRSRYGHAIKLIGLLNVFSLLFAAYDNVRSIELLTAGFLFMWALRPINL